LQDFDANTITPLGSTPFVPPAGADQIRLLLDRPDVSNDNFFASFSYLSSGSVLGGGAFSTPAQLFQGEEFVRAGFFASEEGSTPNNPFLPSSVMNGIFTFPNPLRGQWFDPPFVDGFTYTLTGGATFTEVGVPPASFGFGPVDVVVGGVVLDTLDPDEHFVFGPGVTTFSLQGISPLVDAADPRAFPTFLDFTGTATTLTMAALTPTAIPEPSTWLLLATGCVGFLVYYRRQRKQ
jgi:hypothetical protein